MSEQTTWCIRISGYGTFDFFGTQTEADKARENKARWERATSMMWRKDLARPSDKIKAQIAASFDEKGSAPRLLFTRLRRAKALELANAEAP
jgi:hypothetical protein